MKLLIIIIKFKSFLCVHLLFIINTGTVQTYAFLHKNGQNKSIIINSLCLLIKNTTGIYMNLV